MLNFINYCSTMIFLNKKNWRLLLMELYNVIKLNLLQQSLIKKLNIIYYNSKFEVKPFEDTQLVKSDDLMDLKIKRKNIKSVKQVEIELHIILSLNLFRGIIKNIKNSCFNCWGTNWNEWTFKTRIWWISFTKLSIIKRQWTVKWSTCKSARTAWNYF